MTRGRQTRRRQTRRRQTRMQTRLRHVSRNKKLTNRLQKHVTRKQIQKGHKNRRSRIRRQRGGEIVGCLMVYDRLYPKIRAYFHVSLDPDTIKISDTHHQNIYIFYTQSLLQFTYTYTSDRDTYEDTHGTSMLAKYSRERESDYTPISTRTCNTNTCNRHKGVFLVSRYNEYYFYINLEVDVIDDAPDTELSVECTIAYSNEDLTPVQVKQLTLSTHYMFKKLDSRSRSVPGLTLEKTYNDENCKTIESVMELAERLSTSKYSYLRGSMYRTRTISLSDDPAIEQGPRNCLSFTSDLIQSIDVMDIDDMESTEKYQDNLLKIPPIR